MTQEERFNAFYNDFFETKLKPYIKQVKQNHYKCSSNCEGDLSCIDKCSKPYEQFYDRIESLLKEKLETFPNCMQKCTKDQQSCIEDCTTHTLKVLNSIKLHSEFSQFLDK